MVQNAAEELAKKESQSEEDKTLVYDNFPEEEDDVAEKVEEEDVGMSDAAAAEDSEDEFVLLKDFCMQRDPPWLWNPGQMSPKTQNRGISDPTKRTYVRQKFYLKKRFDLNLFTVYSCLILVRGAR